MTPQRDPGYQETTQEKKEWAACVQRDLAHCNTSQFLWVESLLSVSCPLFADFHGIKIGVCWLVCSKVRFLLHNDNWLEYQLMVGGFHILWYFIDHLHSEVSSTFTRRWFIKRVMHTWSTTHEDQFSCYVDHHVRRIPYRKPQKFVHSGNEDVYNVQLHNFDDLRPQTCIQQEKSV